MGRTNPGDPNSRYNRECEYEQRKNGILTRQGKKWTQKENDRAMNAFADGFCFEGADPRRSMRVLFKRRHYAILKQVQKNCSRYHGDGRTCNDYQRGKWRGEKRTGKLTARERVMVSWATSKAGEANGAMTMEYLREILNRSKKKCRKLLHKIARERLGLIVEAPRNDEELLLAVRSVLDKERRRANAEIAKLKKKDKGKK